MFDIRVNGKYFDILSKMYNASSLNKEKVIFKHDENVKEPVVMVQSTNGTIYEWCRGLKQVSLFIKHGYNKITKKCPYSFLGMMKCKGEACQLYLVHNATGDCSIRWTAITKLPN